MHAVIGQTAPNLHVSEWVQGMPTNFDQEKDHIVVVEVFQVNCPGCFLYGIPEAISVYEQYSKEGVRVIGVATAFEDFNKNTLENLKLLVKTGEVIGDTKQGLRQYGKLCNDKLSYKIPFPLAMDKMTKHDGSINNNDTLEFIHGQIPDFDSQPKNYKEQIMERVREHLKAKEYSAHTFENYKLRGTPSTILVDRNGILRDVTFGQVGHLESVVKSILAE
ncbi:MAG: thiol-disulfide isomerase [Cenarchaeum symbiont of Oopsacas minuta]|nr:thiol-disulfide isomerase [Cenarchaeum symbiont of Oopsacas minuta]